MANPVAASTTRAVPSSSPRSTLPSGNDGGAENLRRGGANSSGYKRNRQPSCRRLDSSWRSERREGGTSAGAASANSPTRGSLAKGTLATCAGSAAHSATVSFATDRQFVTSTGSSIGAEGASENATAERSPRSCDTKRPEYGTMPRKSTTGSRKRRARSCRDYGTKSALSNRDSSDLSVNRESGERSDYGLTSSSGSCTFSTPAPTPGTPPPDPEPLHMRTSRRSPVSP